MLQWRFKTFCSGWRTQTWDSRPSKPCGVCQTLPLKGSTHTWWDWSDLDLDLTVDLTVNIKKSHKKCNNFIPFKNYILPMNQFSWLSSPMIGVVQWDGVKAPRLHRCEECHPQDAGKKQCCAGLEHWTQHVYSWTEMGICLQQSPGAKGYLTLHNRHVLPLLSLFLVPACFCCEYSKLLYQRDILFP